MNKRRNHETPVTISTEVLELSDGLSFLDVLSTACARNARYTLSLESAGTSYTVLVDRGGPFNATGGGATGGTALVRAAQLRSGRCTVLEGWPVDQPQYQPGLDNALSALLNGVVEPASLPRPRGVESLRNAEFVAGPSSEANSPETYVRPAETVTDQERLLASLPPAAAPRYVPVPSPAPASAPTAPRVANAVPTASAPAVPQAAEPTAGKARRLATRALLWMVEVEDGAADYSLRQAATLARRGLVDGIGDMVHPLRQGLGNRIDRVRTDWHKSGEVAASRTRKAAASRRVTVPGDFDPGGEFRLR
ncbi:MAG: hypothetical protein ABR573_02170 [Candidatus Dormibacteria bacterium]